MKDIGLVKFILNDEKTSITSEWVYTINDNTYTGTGIVEGEITNDYCGKFKVTYFNADGKIIHEYELVITKNEDYYNLEWWQKGKVVYIGIGMLNNNILYAGWRLA